MTEKRIGFEVEFQNQNKILDKQRSIEGMIRALESRRGLTRDDQIKLNKLRNQLRGLSYTRSKEQ